MNHKVIIVGAFEETIELCQEAGFDIVGIVDNQIKGDFCGIPIIGTDDDAIRLHEENPSCGVVITPDSPRLKEKLMEVYQSAGFSCPTVISPLAHISKSAIIQKGTLIQAGVNISSNVHVGMMVKLNFNVNVMHDVKIDDFCIIAPNAILLGRSSVHTSSYIGANSIIFPDVCVPKLSNVKPCTVVSNDGYKE